MTQVKRFSPPRADERGALLSDYRESERFVKENERERITSISRTTWWRLEKAGQVPKRKRVGGSTVWLLSDLLAWMQK
ncbi:helix-turn-helix transcriptional regulator [Vibrio cholerae]|nr:AlpA family phage regulatory protein [Vibrio cholerae]HEG4439384.1 AlpA family phage regulatory protein [Vibrio cholerae]